MHFISVHKRNCNEPAMIHLQLRTNKKYEIQSAAEYGSLNSPSDLNRTGYLIHLECEKIQQATLSFFFSKVWEKLYSFLHLYTLRSKTWCCHDFFLEMFFMSLCVCFPNELETREKTKTNDHPSKPQKNFVSTF